MSEIGGYPPVPQPQYQQPAEAKKPKTVRRRTAFLLAAFTGFAGLAIGAASATGTGDPEATPTPPTMVITNERIVTAPPETVTAKPPAPAPAPPAKATIPGDGTFLVPDDVKPGTYKSVKPSSGNCYWARLKSPDGAGVDDIIANNNSAGPSVVNIGGTDKAFQTQGCEEWVKIR